MLQGVLQPRWVRGRTLSLLASYIAVMPPSRYLCDVGAHAGKRYLTMPLFPSMPSALTWTP